MAKSRLELQTLLEELLGSRNVYFQPPENLKMKYPAIVYERSGIDEIFADNEAYRTLKRYTITYIDEDPDSEIPDKLQALRYCYFDTHFASENLNHDVFTLYY